MTRFRVTVVETITNWGYVEVEAETPREAAVKAEESYNPDEPRDSRIENDCRDARPVNAATLEEEGCVLEARSTRLEGGPRAGYFRAMVDRAEFRTVKRYLRSATSEISEVLLAAAGTDLAELAAYLEVDGLARGARGLELARRGAIRFAVERPEDVPEPWAPYVVALDGLGDEQSCRVVYAPPAYLVELLP